MPAAAPKFPSIWKGGWVLAKLTALMPECAGEIAKILHDYEIMLLDFVDAAFFM